MATLIRISQKETRPLIGINQKKMFCDLDQSQEGEGSYQDQLEEMQDVTTMLSQHLVL